MVRLGIGKEILFEHPTLISNLSCDIDESQRFVEGVARGETHVHLTLMALLFKYCININDSKLLNLG